MKTCKDLVRFADTYTIPSPTFLSRLREILQSSLQGCSYTIRFNRIGRDGPYLLDIEVDGGGVRFPIGSVESRTGVSHIFHLLEEFGPAILGMIHLTSRWKDSRGWGVAYFKYQSVYETDSEWEYRQTLPPKTHYVKCAWSISLEDLDLDLEEGDSEDEREMKDAWGWAVDHFSAHVDECLVEKIRGDR